MAAPRKHGAQLPTSKINRLFRPFLSKITALTHLFPTSPTSPGSSSRSLPGSTSSRTYSRRTKPEPTQWTGTSKGLPVFEKGKKMRRSPPIPIPRELLPIASPASRLKGALKAGISMNENCHPSLPKGVELDELSKRIHGVVEAFQNILDIVYPLSINPTGFEPLGALCARRIGENIESWIKDQLDEELGDVGPGDGDEIESKREGRSVSLRDDWWEGVPEHFRKYTVPVHALSILLSLNIPLHGFYESVLDACIKKGAVYEISLLLPHLIFQAYTIPSTLHPPGPSYFPTLARKVPTTQHQLATLWPRILSKSIISLHRRLDQESPENLEAREVRWLGASMDGLIRDGSKTDASGAYFLLESLDNFLESTTPTSPPLSDRFALRLSLWLQYQLWLRNHLESQENSNTIVQTIDSFLSQLTSMMHDCLPPSTSEVLSGALLALDLHMLCVKASSINSDPISPVKLPPDEIDRETTTFILSTHPSLSTVYALVSCLRAVSLPNLESAILNGAVEEYDRLSPFADSSKLSMEERQLQASSLEDLCDMATAADARCARRGTATPGGTKKGLRWEELVGGWIEATPALPRAQKVDRTRQTRSPPIEILDDSSEDDLSGTYSSMSSHSRSFTKPKSPSPPPRPARVEKGKRREAPLKIPPSRSLLDQSSLSRSVVVPACPVPLRPSKRHNLVSPSLIRTKSSNKTPRFFSPPKAAWAENEENEGYSSDDMDLFSAESPVKSLRPLKQAPKAFGTGGADGLREQLGRKRVVNSLRSRGPRASFDGFSDF